ncbi:MAG: NusG domain II-containing protein [Clostridia bacterium]|nr:NusG domain II-containing protein [Clostridia bacterium]
MKRKLLGKADLIIIVLLFAIAVVLLLPRFFSDDKLTAVISQNGETVKTIDLSAVTESYEIKLDGAVILVEKNAVSFKSAECPDRLCVKCGRLTHAGDTAVCVPTRTVITVSGSEKTVDVISY